VSEAGAKPESETDPSGLQEHASQRLLSEDASLVDSLQGVAAAGCSLIDGCRAASITLIETARPLTVAATDDTARAVDRAQYEADDGPCLTAAREERAIWIEDITDIRQWPRFAAAAVELGVGSSLSLPLSLAGGTYGGLNLYGAAAGAFDEHDREVASAFASQASAVVMNAVAYWGVHEQAANLIRAMEHRAVIEQAKGILIASEGCSPDEAFDLLRRASQRENRKLRDLAAELVERRSGADRTGTT
jgi:GAF domain-containing protein